MPSSQFRALLAAVALAASAADSDAGDVAVVSDKKGALNITGGDGSDHVRVLRGAGDGALVVAPGAGTTLNGGDAAIDVPAAKSVRVTLGGGDDRLEVGDGFAEVTVPGRVRIDAGEGLDRVEITKAVLAAGADIRVSAGAGGLDFVSLRSSNVATGDLRLRAGASQGLSFDVQSTTFLTGGIVAEGSVEGLNQVLFDRVDVEAGGVVWHGGTADDNLRLAQVAAAGRLDVVPGVTGVHQTVVDGGHFDGGARIGGGSGRDVVQLFGATFAGKGLALDTGKAGFDEVATRGLQIFGALRVQGSRTGFTQMSFTDTLAGSGAGADVRLGKGGGQIVTNNLEVPGGAFALASTGPLDAQLGRLFTGRGLTILCKGQTGFDNVLLASPIVDGPVRIDAGAGTIDHISIFGGQINGPVRLRSSAQIAEVTLTDVTFASDEPVEILTGGGEDQLRIEGCAVPGILTANLGTSDDVTYIDGNDFGRAFNLDGSIGVDRLCDGFVAVNTFSGERAIRNVEEAYRVEDGEPATGCGPNTRRVSVAPGGGDGNEKSRLGAGSKRVFKDDGGSIVFQSDASNLVAGDTNDGTDIFVAHLGDEVTVERVSVRSDGGQFVTTGPFEDPPRSLGPSMSHDGRFIAFDSNAADAVDGDENVAFDVFLRDRLAGTTVAISDPTSHQRSTGGIYRYGQAFGASISGEGRDVVFVSSANYLGGEDNTTLASPHVWKGCARNAGGVSRLRVSVRDDGVEPPSGNHFTGGAVLDFSGANCAFHTRMALAPGADAPDSMVYLRSFASPAHTELISKTADGRAFVAFSPSLSNDGNLVAFLTSEPLDARDTNGTIDIYVKNRTTGAFTWASPPPAGGFLSSFGPISQPWIAGGGGYVVFSGPGLSVRGFTLLVADVFLHDLATGVTVEFGQGMNGDSNGDSRAPAITSDGRFFAWTTNGDDMAEESDGNFADDVYVQDRGAGAVQALAGKSRPRVRRVALPGSRPR